MDAGDDAGEFATRRDAKANGRAATAARRTRDAVSAVARRRRRRRTRAAVGGGSGQRGRAIGRDLGWAGRKATRDARRDGEGVARALDFDDDDDGGGRRGGVDDDVV